MDKQEYFSKKEEAIQGGYDKLMQFVDEAEGEIIYNFYVKKVKFEDGSSDYLPMVQDEMNSVDDGGSVLKHLISVMAGLYDQYKTSTEKLITKLITKK